MSEVPDVQPEAVQPSYVVRRSLAAVAALGATLAPAHDTVVTGPSEAAHIVVADRFDALPAPEHMTVTIPDRHDVREQVTQSAIEGTGQLGVDVSAISYQEEIAKAELAQHEAEKAALLAKIAKEVGGVPLATLHEAAAFYFDEGFTKEGIAAIMGTTIQESRYHVTNGWRVQELPNGSSIWVPNGRYMSLGQYDPKYRGAGSPDPDQPMSAHLRFQMTDMDKRSDTVGFDIRTVLSTSHSLAETMYAMDRLEGFNERDRGRRNEFRDDIAEMIIERQAA